MPFVTFEKTSFNLHIVFLTEKHTTSFTSKAENPHDFVKIATHSPNLRFQKKGEVGEVGPTRIPPVRIRIERVDVGNGLGRLATDHHNQLNEQM